MRNYVRTSLAVLMGGMLLLPATAHAKQVKTVDDHLETGRCMKHVQLSKSQSSKMNKQLDQFYAANKGLLETYAEAGAISKAEKTLKLEHIRHYIESVKKNGYHACLETGDGEIEYHLQGGTEQDNE